MHTQERSIENHDTRRATTKEILSRLCPDKHDEHDWNQACHDFLQVNFAEIEARVVAHHLANGSDANFDALVDGHEGTMIL
jgi:hypothetical protein